ncbi:hypothetical protein [Pseudonocardia kunmingensis]|uniref:hypothetical protein n=1 Tax=Pseudonocardia kunmingensis TaxID=630975 RepID=UPI0014791AFD|nr:hypothetical protein [Pseudonocardia kunmingensis]
MSSGLPREQGRRFPVSLAKLVVADPEVTSLPEYLRCSDIAMGLCCRSLPPRAAPPVR